MQRGRILRESTRDFYALSMGEKKKNFRGRMREEIFRKLFLENILSFDRTNERMKVNGRRNFFQMLNTSQDSI